MTRRGKGVLFSCHSRGDHESRRAHIHDERLIPFWFHCLYMESETIRNLALTGLYFFAYDRNHGLFSWHPEKDISRSMYSAIVACKDDPSNLVRGQAGLVRNQLRAAGLKYDGD